MSTDGGFLPFNKKHWLNAQVQVFFVGLSHKLWKQGQTLEAFDQTTSSGQLLSPILQEFWETLIYSTNLVKWVPLDHFWKLRYPSIEEKEIWLQQLISEIKKFEPKIVFLFGKQVSDFVIKNLEASQLNQNTYHYDSSILIAIDHPSYIAVYKRKHTEKYLQDIKNIINYNF